MDENIRMLDALQGFIVPLLDIRIVGHLARISADDGVSGALRGVVLVVPMVVVDHVLQGVQRTLFLAELDLHAGDAGKGRVGGLQHRQVLLRLGQVTLLDVHAES